ncbi:golgin subfamily A member 2-like [Heterocephalus glaber]|uniref:Golgin subfamily A member 2-like n=1 Tax=Heterocephalus glaber TaxID=10181 RepID=A0AAX6TM61_HETGA|nr:golgin subfamily A member 2-like [Heterocephalus glaber]
MDLKADMAVPPALQPPAGPSEEQLQLKCELQQLKHQLELVLEELKTQKKETCSLCVRTVEQAEQLAQMQDSVLRQSEDNLKMASALQSEQLERKELARKLGQLQEKMVQLMALRLENPDPRKRQAGRRGCLSLSCILISAALVTVSVPPSPRLGVHHLKRM